jgi:hypothetical protein
LKQTIDFGPVKSHHRAVVYQDHGDTLLPGSALDVSCGVGVLGHINFLEADIVFFQVLLDGSAPGTRGSGKYNDSRLAGHLDRLLNR